MTAPDPQRLLRDIETDHFYRQVRKKWHRPRFYRTRVAGPHTFRPVLNRYPHHIIGAAVTIGRYAYCVKWASL